MTIFSQLSSQLRSLIAAMLAVLIAISAFATPVAADTAGQRSTRTLILSGLAAAALIVLYNNYHHKQVAANTVVGYTRDGGTIHADGRITYPDGTVLYAGNANRQRCSYDGYGTPCGQRTYAYHGYYSDQNPCMRARDRGNGPPAYAPAYGRRNRGACDRDDRHRNGDNDDNQGNED